MSEIPRECIDDVIDFCYDFKVPNIGNALQTYELIYNNRFDNYNNKMVALTEIFGEFANIYQAYWDDNLKYNLNKYKVKR